MKGGGNNEISRVNKAPYGFEMVMNTTEFQECLWRKYTQHY